MQTAKPTDKGSVDFGTGLGAPSLLEYDGYPSLSSQLRIGISSKSDIGIRYDAGFYWWFGRLGIDYKHNWWKSQNKNAYFSSGIGITNEITGSVSDSDFKIDLPFYYSVNHNTPMTYYFCSMFSMTSNRFNFFESPSSSPFSYTFYSVNGAGFQLGKHRIRWFVELFLLTEFRSYHTSTMEQLTEFSFDINHLATGIYINGKKKLKIRGVPGL